MKAWLLSNVSDLSALTLADVPDPSPGPGEIVLQLHFAALNPADRYLALGQYPAKPTFPHVLGRDGVGHVIKVGDGVSNIKPGDTRLILRGPTGVDRWGTFAQQVAVDANYTVPLPQNWSEEQSAAAPLVYVTAWQALTQWGPLPEKAVILVTGASGGVGVAAIQLAHALGYRPIGLSRSKEKSAQLKTLGAELTLDPTQKSWRDDLKNHLGKQRVDLAIDNIGGDPFNAILDVMAMHGRISCVGRLAGPVPSFNTAALFFRRLKIGGVAIATYTREESHTAWNTVLSTLQKTNAKPFIDHVYPFNDLLPAFTRLAEGPMGKVLLHIPR